MKTRKPRATRAPSGSRKEGGNTKKETKAQASAKPRGASGPNSSGAPLFLLAFAVRGDETLLFLGEDRRAAAPLVAR